MQIHLSDISSSEGKSQHYSVAFEMDTITFQQGTFPVLAKEPVELTITNTGDRVLELEGSGLVTVGIPCDRCLEPVDYSINIDCFKDLDLNKTSEERIADLDEEPYLDGTKFDSEVFIYNEILVNLPMKVLCRTDCKGICNRCGANLNLRTCKCEDAEPGTGMSKILDIFNQFKEV